MKCLQCMAHDVNVGWEKYPRLCRGCVNDNARDIRQGKLVIGILFVSSILVWVLILVWAAHCD